MNEYQMFWKGFWSVWDFYRPFSEPPDFCQQEGLNENVWDAVGSYFKTVGGHLYSAMEKMDEEIAKNDRSTHTRQET